MKLSDLCTVCEPSKYDPTIYDDYGDKVEPKLCDEEIIEKSVITNVLVQEVIPFDKMMETNESVFTTKNKLYCGEK
jgi:hypothetical protein